MTLLFVQFLCSLFLGWGMWRLWRYLGRQERAVRLIVGLGFLGRAFLGLALFWISYLELPFARSMQLGEGIWFFAVDAIQYLQWAEAAAQGGFEAIASVPRSGPSVGFVQALAVFLRLFGGEAAGGLLLNLVCYLGIAALIVFWSSRLRDGRKAGLIALVGVTFAPGAALWSLQPLKDTYFQFLIVAFVMAAVVWQWSWRSSAAARAALVAAGVMVVVMFNVSGIRWYYAFTTFGVSLLFLLVSGLTANRRMAATLCGAVVAVLLAFAFLRGAGPYVPPAIRGLFAADRVVEASPSPSDESIGETVERVRTGFEVAPGATSIRVGRAFGKKAAAAPQKAGAADLRPSRAERLAAGMVAFLVPREIAVRLGLVDIPGGQGLVWFADLDTLFFDIMLIVAIVYVSRRWRAAAWRNPVFWLVLLVAVGLAGPLVYVITNLGTLIRLRAMVYTGLVLLPLALESGRLLRGQPVQAEAGDADLA